MRQTDRTYQEKLNELRLDISHPNSNGSVFVLVEGDSDIRLFRKFFNLNNSKVEKVPGGNPKLEECVETLVNTYPLVLGIRDADFTRIESSMNPSEDIISTQHHDIEMDMLSNNSILSALVFEFSSMEENQHQLFRENLIESISCLSCLKWLNTQQNLKMKFDCGFHDLVSLVDYKMDLEEYINRVLSKSPNATNVDVADLINQTKGLKNTNPDLYQITNGHDLMNILAKYVREVEGVNGMSGKTLESSMRMSYSKAEFMTSHLHSEINNWQLLKGVQIV